MNNNLFFQCNSHEPPIRSNAVGRNLEQLSVVQDDLRNRATLVETITTAGNFVKGGDPLRVNALFFFHEHPYCDLDIVDGYNKLYPSVSETPVEAPRELWSGPTTQLGVASAIITNEDGVQIRFDSLTEEGRAFFGIPDTEVVADDAATSELDSQIDAMFPDKVIDAQERARLRAVLAKEAR